MKKKTAVISWFLVFTILLVYCLPVFAEGDSSEQDDLVIAETLLNESDIDSTENDYEKMVAEDEEETTVEDEEDGISSEGEMKSSPDEEAVKAVADVALAKVTGQEATVLDDATIPAGSNTGGDANNFVISRGRMTIIKFELTGKPDGAYAQKALLNLSKWRGTNQAFGIFYFPNNDWDENTVNSEYKVDGEKSLLNFFNPNGSNDEYAKVFPDSKVADNPGGVMSRDDLPSANNADLQERLVLSADRGVLKDYFYRNYGPFNVITNLDVTDIINKAIAAGQNQVTLGFITPFHTTSALEFYSKEETDESRHPKLVIDYDDGEDTIDLANDSIALKEIMRETERTLSNQSLTLPTSLSNGTSVSWSSSAPEYLDAEGNVNQPSYTQGDQYVTLTAVLNKGDLSMTHTYNYIVMRQEPSPEQLLELDFQTIKAKFNNETVTGNLTLMNSSDLTYGCEVESYTSSDTTHFAIDGVNVTVVRPGLSEATAEVKVTVELSYTADDRTTRLSDVYPNAEDRQFTIYVQKDQTSMAAQAKENLGKIIDRAKTELDQKYYVSSIDVSVDAVNTPDADKPAYGSLWGQHPIEAYDAFKAQIEAAEEVFNSADAAESDYYNQSSNLIDAGVAYIQTINLDDTVLVKNLQDHKIVFSEYRRNLLAYVYQAETMLMFEDYYYPKSAKIALQKEIDGSREALDYAYTFPFTRSRGFIIPREDEHLRQKIERYSKDSATDGQSKSGIAATIEWYKGQHILMNAYRTIVLTPTDDAYINIASGGSNYAKAGDLVIGNSGEDFDNRTNRVSLMKFNLSELKGSIIGAKIAVSNFKSDNGVLDFELMEDPAGIWDGDNWSEDNITFNYYASIVPTKSDGSLQEQKIVASLQPGSKNATGAGKGRSDITDAVRQEYAGDQIMTLMIVLQPHKFPHQIHSKDTTTAGCEPMLEVTLNEVPQAGLQEIYDNAVEKANELLAKSEGNIGNQVGNYREEDVQPIRDALSRAKEGMDIGDSVMLGTNLVSVYDSMRDMRDNQVLRTAVDANANLFFTAVERQQMRNKIDTMSTLNEYYNNTTLPGANSTTLKDFEDRMFLMEPDYTTEQLNQYFNAFRDHAYGDSSIKAPVGSQYISVEMKLPSENNTRDAERDNAEKEKLAMGMRYDKYVGHVWIDTITLTDANGNVLGDNSNLGFEEWSGNIPKNWKVSGTGNAKITPEETKNFVADGAYSVRMENPTSSDEAALIYVDESGSEKIKFTDSPLTADRSMTANFKIKIDGFLRGYDSHEAKTFNNSGVEMITSFYDENGAFMTSYTTMVNKHSGSSYGFSQNDAIAYMKTGDITYAQKVKDGLLLKLNDFCQGAESWIVNNERPQDVDAYGEVQAGRQLAMAASCYALIEDANVFSYEEYQQLVRLFQYIVDFSMNIRDQTVYNDEAVKATNNWHTDMYAGSAITALALRKKDANGDFVYDSQGRIESAIPCAKQIVDNNRWLQINQLNENIAASGAYSESIRYLWGAYSRVTSLTKVYANELNDNWYKVTKLPLLFEYVVQTHTPKYRYIGNKVSSPPFGDNTISEGPTGMAMLGQYFEEVSEVNPVLGMQMLEVWKSAGMPINADREGILLSAYFVPQDIENKDNVTMNLASTDFYHQKSPIIMRNNQGLDNETYLCVLSSTDPLNHGHLDQGSLQLFANGSLLVADPGIENYWDATTKRLYTSSSYHSAFTYRTNNRVFWENNVKEGAGENGTDLVDLDIALNHTETTDVGTTSTLTDSYFSDAIDGVSIQVNNDHTRNLAYVKSGLNAVIIWDRNKNTSALSQFNLPVVATATSIQGNKVISTGHYGTDLETTVLEPKGDDVGIVYDRLRAVDVAPPLPNYSYSTTDVIHAISKNPGQNHLTVLYPKTTGASGLTTGDISTGNKNVKAYRIADSNGHWVIAAANASNSAQSVNLGSDMIDMRTGQAFSGSIPAGGLVVVSQMETPKPNSVSILGATNVSRPTSNQPLTYNYSAVLLDQYGNKMTGLGVYSENPNDDSLELYYNSAPYALPENGAPTGYNGSAVFKSPHPMNIGIPKISWSVQPEVKGVSVDENGILSISKDCSASTINLVAESNGKSAKLELNLGNTVTSRATSIKILDAAGNYLDGAQTIGLYPSRETSIQYSYLILDQFGVEMESSDKVVWELTANIDGASIDHRTGKLTLTAAAVDALLENPNEILTIRVRSESNTLLQTTVQVSTEISKPSQIVSDLPEQLQIPLDGSGIYGISSYVVNQNGEMIEDAIISYSIKSLVGADGQPLDTSLVQIDENGIMTISSEIPEGAVVVIEVSGIAKDAGGSEVYIAPQEVTVTFTSQSIVSEIAVSGKTSIAAGNTNVTEKYTATAYDQYGNVMSSVPTLTWKATGMPGGVAFNRDTQELIVSASANSGKVTIMAATEDNKLSGSLTVTITGNSQNNNGSGGGSSGGLGGGFGSAGFGSAGLGSVALGGVTGAAPDPVGGSAMEQQLFYDVPSGYWAYSYIQLLANNGIVKGVGNGMFMPDDNVTRAEFVQMIINTLGFSGGEAVTFNDVSANDWFAEAVAIGQQHGYILGYEDGNFRPYENITREQMAVIIERVFNDIGITLDEANTDTIFSDEDTISEYAVNSVKLMKNAGIINGYEDGSFKPQNNATRSESAKIICYVFEQI